MDDAFERAMAIRRAVLGDDYVNRAMANVTPLTQSFQEFVTRWAWGEAWLDDSLDLRSRSLVTLAAVTVLGNLNEVRLHTGGALRNGCTPEEIAAVLKHVAVYAGVAKAVAALNVVVETLAAEPELAKPAQASTVAADGSQ